jgi:putative ABC transport system permease protein
MLLLTLRDLQYRAVRFLTVVVGTAVVFTLLFLMTGLTEQFHREPRMAVAALGGDAWVVGDGATGVFTSAATLDPALAAEVVTTGRADPIVAARHSLDLDGGTRDIVVIGAVADGIGMPAVAAGRLPASPGEVVIDVDAGLEVGDAAVIGSHTYEVVGLTTDATLFAGMPLVFMGLGDAQTLVYRGQDLATAIAATGDVSRVPNGLAVLTSEAVAEDALRPLERSISSVNLIRILLWVVAAMVVGAVMYLSALERRRDFAVLKAMGSGTRGLLAGIGLQSGALGLIAAVIAIGLQILLVPLFPLKVHVPGAALVQIPLLAVAVALVAAVGGARKVVRVDPAVAFAGPGA